MMEVVVGCEEYQWMSEGWGLLKGGMLLAFGLTGEVGVCLCGDVCGRGKKFGGRGRNCGGGRFCLFGRLREMVDEGVDFFFWDIGRKESKYGCRSLHIGIENCVCLINCTRSNFSRIPHRICHPVSLKAPL